CVASSEVKGCAGGWVEFTCGYEEDEYYRKIVVEIPKGRPIEITEGGVWKQEGNISLYHDTKNKKITVAIKQLQREDSGKYEYKFDLNENNSEEQEEENIKVEVEKDGCQGPFNQTAYRTAKTTITCNYKGKRDESDVLFFCKENNFTCEDILSTESSPKSNGTFTLTKNNTGFSVSISEVSSLHAGVYWCGVKSNEGSYRAGFRKIQLEVKNITNFTRSPTIGQNFSYWCEYPNDDLINKFICKGEDPSICEPLVNTMQRNKNTGRFSMEDDKNKRNITITVRDVTADDTGTYWCGAKSTNKSQSNPFFNRLSMTVAGDSSSRIPIVAVVVGVALLALLLFLVLLYKRCEAVSNVKGCRDGWVDFTCKYQKSGFTSIKRGYKLIQSSKKNEWETTNSVSLYRDTNNKKVRVVIKKLKKEDFAEYQCEEHGTDFNTVKLNNENDFTCEDILSTESSPKSSGTFTLTETNTGFNVSISEVSSLHAGVYWCGVKSNEGSYRAGFRKIQLEVEDIKNFTRSLTIGQNFTYWCEYPNGTVRKKFICKGEDPSICEPLVNTMERNKNTGRFSMEDDKKQKITVTVRDVTADDTGTYWCGAKSTDDKHSNPFFNRFSMTVVTQSSPPTPTSHVSSAQSTTTSTTAENNGGSWGIITMAARVGVLLLVPLVLILIFIYRRCEAVSNVKGCRDGWVEFTCKYRKSGFPSIKRGYKLIQSSKKNEWETTNSVSLYRDTNNKKVRVVIKKLKHQDFVEYQCEEHGSDFNTVKLNNDNGCQGEFIQTAYRTAKTTITCNYKGNRDESDVLFFCKENDFTCEEILSTESSPKSSGTFTLTETNTGFNVSISEVSSLHAGVYWCGVKSNEGSYRAGFRKIQLEVEDIKNFTRSLTIGQNFTYWCEYPNGTVRKKFICKGEDPSICEPLVNTMELNKNTGRFSMEDNKNKRNITITVRDVTADDTGTYWCGAKSTDDKRSNPFFNRLSMIVGCEAVSNVKGCRDGWVDFTCKYQKSGFTLIKQGCKLIQSSKNNEWETANGISLYRDTNNKKVRVVIKKLKKEDFAEYQCEEHGTDFNTVKLNNDRDKGCQGEFIQTAYRTSKTTITCNYKGNRDESDVLFFCKENKITCEDILSTESSPKSNGTFTLTKNNTGFNVSISELSSLHAGVYWCGVKSNEGSYRAGFRKIQLEVKGITNFRRSPTIGQNFTYWCEYPNDDLINKFICKGEDPSICEPLVNTMELNKNTGRFSMEDDNKKRNITITVRDVTADDTGTYWCGAKSTDDKHSNPFFNRLSMTVAGDSSSRIPIVAVVVGVALLALLLFVVLLYKRSEHRKNTSNEEAQNNNEVSARI
ncbi:Stabilin-1, partial [Nibea albiflora]